MTMAQLDVLFEVDRRMHTAPSSEADSAPRSLARVERGTIGELMAFHRMAN